MKIITVTGKILNLGEYESFYKYNKYNLYYNHDTKLLGIEYTSELSNKPVEVLDNLFATFPQTTLEYIEQFPPKFKMSEEYMLNK